MLEPGFRPPLIVGAGFSGAVIARLLAEAGVPTRVIEARAHVAGNCHTARDPETGVMEHMHGPHIFHTDDAGVWQFVQRFARFRPYRHSVRAIVGGRAFSLPMNLGTINAFFGRNLTPDEARAFIAAQTEAIASPANFEEQALATLGRPLYEAFFAGYTAKQWGRDPRDLPAAVLKRLPLRFTQDDSYFAHTHQGIPEDGYTALVTRMLDHPLIRLSLNTPYQRGMERGAHVFWSGPLDAWFDHDAGRLGYRTLRFVRQVHDGDAQGCAVVNYCDADVPWTRITEHKHFAPWETHARSVTYREYSAEAGAGDVPYYPIRLARDTAMLTAYVARARALSGVSFVGRLGTYRYLDMDVTIREAMDIARAYLAGARPVFTKAA
ncbi:MAG: UDP-galactopyranose mutase [Paracoccaceae bacterium]